MQGNRQLRSNNSNLLSYNQKLQILLDHRQYFSRKNILNQNVMKLKNNTYNLFSLIAPQDQDRQRFSKIFFQIKQDLQQKKMINVEETFGLTYQQLRAIGSILGMGICDALGSCTQFMRFTKEGYPIVKDGFSDIIRAVRDPKQKVKSRHGDITIWTDDASMGLCIAYSLLLRKFQFDPIHLRYMFILWLYNGLGNGGRKVSIGLGGNISISMDQFVDQQMYLADQNYQGQASKYAKTGNQYNNGNGSLMRLAPVPVAFRDNIQQAMKISQLQSLTTHNGLQAKECSRLLAAIIVNLINRQHEPQVKQDLNKINLNGQLSNQFIKKHQIGNSNLFQGWRKVLLQTCLQFKTDLQAVKCLAKSIQEPSQLYKQQLHGKNGQIFKKFNTKQEDRNWNWRSRDYTYSWTRNTQNPHYIGSYCMDALAMALHTVWWTNSFKECAVWNANMGGDCDTVGSIAGQIAGAIYGLNNEMLRLYSEMDDYEKDRYEMFLVGYKLLRKEEHKVQNKKYEVQKMQIY